MKQIIHNQFFSKINKSQIFIIIISIVIGILAAYGAILFRFLISAITSLFSSTDNYNINILNSLDIWQRILFPTIGGLIVGIIVYKFAPEVKGSGIPEVIKSIALKGGIIRFRVLITKAFAAAITIGSGGSAGREGPVVHIGSAIASVIGQIFKVSTKNLRTLVACGAASAISATFNAPFAGTLFSFEVIMGQMSALSMPPVIISSVIASMVSRHYFGNFPEFNVLDYYMINPIELIFYAILGILASFCSIIFVFFFIKTSNYFEKLNIPMWIKPAIGGFFVGLIAIFVPNIFGVGYATINCAIWDKIEISFLLILVVAKIAATCLSLGSGASGGIFAPSLFIGATLGSAWGKIVFLFYPDIVIAPGIYSLVGMGAVVSAVTHAPISAIMIIFELTNSFEIITPLMLSCIISLLITNKIIKKSIYLAKLESGGFKIQKNNEINILREIKVNAIMDKDPVLIHVKTPFQSIITKLLIGKRPNGVVVGDGNMYIGIIGLNDIRSVLPDSDELCNIVIAKDIVNTDIPYVFENDNLDIVMKIFGKKNIDEIAVCDSSLNKKVVAVVTKNALIDVYNNQMYEKDFSGSFVSIIDSIKQGQKIEIFHDIYITEVEVLDIWIGKSLLEIDLRKKYNLQVIAISRNNDNNKMPKIVPNPYIKILTNDKLLVIGDLKSITNIQI